MSDHDMPPAAGGDHGSEGETHDAAPPPGAAAGPPPDAGSLPPERRLSRTAAWLAMGAVALALALVSMAPGVEPVSSGGDGDVPPEDEALVGRMAPLHYTLKDMNGIDVKLASFKGKVIVLNFWATWCPPCELEIPDLVQIQKAYPDDVVIVGVSVDDTADMLKAYAAKKKINYPVLLGLDHEDFQDAYGPMYGIPVSVFIGRDGKIARRHSGIFSKEQFVREIEALL
ncbi:MAG TPA: TlpA disulfide reductase family protein [Vicinamibacterales bacterium]|nr:TlpA disulfide reductase family protein [Vicinamibacterales bacterium]